MSVHTIPMIGNGGVWATVEEMLEQWDGAREVLTRSNTKVLFFDYEAAGYEGWAICVYERDGELYLATCSHCSCYGLDSFDEEKTSIAALLMQKRFETGNEAAFEAYLQHRLACKAIAEDIIADAIIDGAILEQEREQKAVTQ